MTLEVFDINMSKIALKWHDAKCAWIHWIRKVHNPNNGNKSLQTFALNFCQHHHTHLLWLIVVSVQAGMQVAISKRVSHDFLDLGDLGGNFRVRGRRGRRGTCTCACALFDKTCCMFVSLTLFASSNQILESEKRHQGKERGLLFACLSVHKKSEHTQTCAKRKESVHCVWASKTGICRTTAYRIRQQNCLLPLSIFLLRHVRVHSL